MSSKYDLCYGLVNAVPSQIAKFMGATWGPPGSPDGPYVGPMDLAIRDIQQHLLNHFITAPKYIACVVRYKLINIIAMKGVNAICTWITLTAKETKRFSRGGWGDLLCCVGCNDIYYSDKAVFWPKPKGHYVIEYILVSTYLCFSILFDIFV